MSLGLSKSYIILRFAVIYFFFIKYYSCPSDNKKKYKEAISPHMNYSAVSICAFFTPTQIKTSNKTEQMDKEKNVLFLSVEADYLTWRGS